MTITKESTSLTYLPPIHEEGRKDLGEWFAYPHCAGCSESLILSKESGGKFYMICPTDGLLPVDKRVLNFSCRVYDKIGGIGVRYTIPETRIDMFHWFRADVTKLINSFHVLGDEKC